MQCGRCPVAVPDKIFGLTLFLNFIDRCHSLGSLHLPPAVLPSLPGLSPTVRVLNIKKRDTRFGYPFSWCR